MRLPLGLLGGLGSDLGFRVTRLLATRRGRLAAWLIARPLGTTTTLGATAAFGTSRLIAETCLTTRMIAPRPIGATIGSAVATTCAITAYAAAPGRFAPRLIRCAGTGAGLGGGGGGLVFSAEPAPDATPEPAAHGLLL